MSTMNLNSYTESVQKNINAPTRKKLEYYSYALDQTIGKGYSSNVFKGKNDITGEPVAIKVIDVKMLKCQVNKMLLSNQIENLKLLSNTPQILQIYQVYYTKNNTYIITQLCQSDLSKRIKRNMDQNEAINCIQQLIQGYLSIYKKQIIHRDLKPANVLIKDGKLKIADFGFSIKASEAEKPSKYNVGSPLYMAPQSLKKNQYSYKSDIWALGIMFYEMLFHQAPWKAKNEKQLIKKIENENIERLINSNNKLNPICRQFLTKSLNSDKTERIGPEDLIRFNFREQTKYLIPRVLKQKWMNDQQKSINLIANASIGIMNMDIAKYKEQQYKQQQNLSRQQRKEISKILISEVHLCRFLYKLICRIKKESKFSDWNELIKQYGYFIVTKINNIKNFDKINFINTKCYEEYKTSADFQKIKKIGKEYFARYTLEFPQCLEFKFDIHKLVRVTQRKIKDYEIQFQPKVTQQNIHVYMQEIIILDYLITTYHLLNLILESSADISKFSKTSKIEEIVEGTPVCLTINHVKKIFEKAGNLSL